MTTTPQDIATIVATIGDEVAVAHKLLIDFEAAVQRQDSSHLISNSNVQGFDLALQILNDVEHLAHSLVASLPYKTPLASPLPMDGLRLERVRKKLRSNKELLSKLDDVAANNRTEFF